MLNQTSLKRLEGVHPHLVAIIRRAADMLARTGTGLSFQVSEGVRTLERQQQLVAKGASRTLNSRHIRAANGYSHAVDLVACADGQVSWDFALYRQLAGIVKQAAAELGHPVEWGGDWATFRDGPHFQLPSASYPGKAAVKPAPVQPGEAGERTLAAGSSGLLVVTLQQALNRHGAGLRVDGRFGARTGAAVQAFQAENGLAADGRAGPRTWKALGLHGGHRDYE